MAFKLNSKSFSSYSKEIKASLIRYFYVTALVVLPVFYDLFSHLFLDERITLGRLINIIICVVLLYFYFLLSVDSKILNLGKSHTYKVKLKDLAKSIRLPLHHIQTKQKRLVSQIDSNHLKEQYTDIKSNTAENLTLYASDAYAYENTSALDPTYNSNLNSNCNPSASDSHTATFNTNPFDHYHFDKEACFDALSITDLQNSNYQNTYSLIDELERNCDKYLAKNTSTYTSSPTTIALETESTEAAATAEAFATSAPSSSTVTVTAGSSSSSSSNSSSTPKLSSAAKKFLSTVTNGTTATTGTTSTTATTSVTATSNTKDKTHSTRNLFKEDKATKTSIFSPSLFKAKATTNYYLHKDFTPEITYTYLGKGFEFKPDHTRLLNNLLNTGLIFNCDECHGSLQIHELEKHNDKSLFTLTSNLKGHTIIFGTTGSGKTRAFDLFISQAILRNEVVIVIDPKGDRDLKANLYKVAELIGREGAVEVLDLVNLKNTTSPFNLLGSSSKPTQIADRLTSLMSNNKDNDFANYAHQAVAAAVIALCFKHKELNLRNITNNLNLISLFDGVLNFIITFLVKTNNDKLVEVFYCFVKDFKLNFKEFTFGDLLKDKILQLEKEKQLEAEFAKVKELRGSSKDKAYDKSSGDTLGDASDDTSVDPSLVSEKTANKDTPNKFSDNQASGDKLSIDLNQTSTDTSFDTDPTFAAGPIFDTAPIFAAEDGSSTTAKAQDVKDTKDTKTSKGVSKKGSSKGASKKSVTDTSSSTTENTKAKTAVNTKVKAAVNAKAKAKASNLGKACKDLKDNKLVDANEPCDKETTKGAKTLLKRLSFLDKVSRIEKLCLRLNELDDRFEITSDLETLLRLCKLDATYFAKVTAGIHPILNTLCLSGLDNYLSASHIALTVAQVYKENKILYVALNSLKDTTLATYVGKLLLSDMASTVSDIYSAKENCDINLKISKNKQSYLKTLESNSLQSFDNLFEFQNLKRKIAVFIDEASEIANEPMLQLLNKSRGAEVNITLATQSYADLVKRTGSESSARQIIANCNTKFSLRVKDDETAKVFTNELQYTSIYQKANAIGQNALSEAITGSDNNSYSKRQTQAELFPPSVLSSLPDFEYVAKLSDGRFVKGVFPILDVESEYGELNGTNKPKKEVLSKIKSVLKDAKSLLVFLSVGFFNILKLIFLVLVWPWFRFLLKAIHHFLIIPIVGPFIRLFNKNLLLPTRPMVDNRYHSRYKKGFMYFFKSYKFYQDNLAFSRAYTEKLDLGDLEGLKDLTPPEPSLEYKLKALKGGTDYKHTHLDQVKMLVRSYNAFLKEQDKLQNKTSNSNSFSETDAEVVFQPTDNSNELDSSSSSHKDNTKTASIDFTAFMESTFTTWQNSDKQNKTLQNIEKADKHADDKDNELFENHVDAPVYEEAHVPSEAGAQATAQAHAKAKTIDITQEQSKELVHAQAITQDQTQTQAQTPSKDLGKVQAKPKAIELVPATLQEQAQAKTQAEAEAEDHSQALAQAQTPVQAQAQAQVQVTPKNNNEAQKPINLNHKALNAQESANTIHEDLNPLKTCTSHEDNINNTLASASDELENYKDTSFKVYDVHDVPNVPNVPNGHDVPLEHYSRHEPHSLHDLHDLHDPHSLSALQDLEASKDNLRKDLKSSLNTSLKDTFKENLELFKTPEESKAALDEGSSNLPCNHATYTRSEDLKTKAHSAHSTFQSSEDSSCSGSSRRSCSSNHSNRSSDCCVYSPTNTSHSKTDSLDSCSCNGDLNYSQSNSMHTHCSTSSDHQEHEYELLQMQEQEQVHNQEQELYQEQEKEFDYETFISSLSDADKAYLSRQAVAASYSYPSSLFKYELKDRLDDSKACIDTKKALKNASIHSKAIFKTCPWSNNEFNVDLFKARFNLSKSKLTQRYHTLNKLNILFYSRLSSTVNQGFTNEAYPIVSRKVSKRRFENNLCKPIFLRLGLTKSICFTIDTLNTKENNYVQRNINYRISSAKCNCTFTTSSYLNSSNLDAAIADDFDKNQRQVKVDFYNSFTSIQQVKKVLLKNFTFRPNLKTSISLNRYFSASKDKTRSFSRCYQPFDNYIIFNLEKAQNFFYQDNLPHPIEVILKDLNSSLEYKPNLKPQSYRGFRRLYAKDYLYKSCYSFVRINFAKRL